MESAGIEVSKLSRVRVGPLSVAGIPRGGYRELTSGELASLMESLHLEREAASDSGPPVAKSARAVPRGPNKRTVPRRARGS